MDYLGLAGVCLGGSGVASVIYYAGYTRRRIDDLEARILTQERRVDSIPCPNCPAVDELHKIVSDFNAIQAAIQAKLQDLSEELKRVRDRMDRYFDRRVLANEGEKHAP